MMRIFGSLLVIRCFVPDTSDLRGALQRYGMALRACRIATVIHNAFVDNVRFELHEKRRGLTRIIHHLSSLLSLALSYLRTHVVFLPPPMCLRRSPRSRHHQLEFRPQIAREMDRIRSLVYSSLVSFKTFVQVV